MRKSWSSTVLEKRR